jgi:hypothetical protein
MGRVVLAQVAGGGDVMSIPVPLGVRLFSVIQPIERWVTRFVDDIQFRSVVPGGFASATVTLRLPRNMTTLANPDPLGFSQLTELFTRVQIVDLETAEIAWEGRIEDPARQVEPDTWQIGALGSMVAATDIQRPVFYIDSSTDDWVSAGSYGPDGNITVTDTPVWSNQKNAGDELTSTHRADAGVFWIAGDLTLGYIYSWRWASHGYDQPIARFVTTHDGAGPDDIQAPNFSLVVGIAAAQSVDATGVEVTSDTTKSNVIGTDFTDVNTRYILLGARRDSGSGNYQITDAAKILYTQWRNPRVIAVRQDRFGNHLTTAASYPQNYVTVAQVVEDVVGRFLVAGWYEGIGNEPWPGSVRPQDVYIDSTSTTQILNLTYPDGATAADILNDLINQVQPNAYWAIWESQWRANDPDTDFGLASGFRFEYATWPNNWGYLASSQDGFEGQPSGDDVYNFVFYRYPDSGDNNQPHVSTTWLVDDMAPELYTGGFTRAITVNKSDATDGSTAQSLRNAYLNSKKKVLNAGTLTVKRPIAFFDAGANSASGASRMLDPWMVRPGKLVRITDLPPRAMERDLSSGTTLPSSGIDGTLFRVVATDYSSADNSCRMSLDQVTHWDIPTQIDQAGNASKTIRIQ